MIEKFLKAKHWQLFILMFGIPVVFQIVMMGTMVSKITTNPNTNPAEIFSMMKFFPIIMLLYMGVFFGWFWSIAVGLQSKIPNHVSMKIKKFKLFFFIPLVYILSMLIFVVVIFNGGLLNGAEPSFGFIGGVVAVVIPLHFLSLFGIFYSMYFVAKTMKTVELQKEVEFGEFVGEFFLLWFYFVGIWILQPKINKMIEDENRPTNSI